MVAMSVVPQFMGQYYGQFVLGTDLPEETRKYHDVATGKGQGVDLFVVHHADRKIVTVQGRLGWQYRQ